MHVQTSEDFQCQKNIFPIFQNVILRGCLEHFKVWGECIASNISQIQFNTCEFFMLLLLELFELSELISGYIMFNFYILDNFSGKIPKKY